MVRYLCTDLKRIVSIALLFNLLLNYTGVDLCVDYCCDKIESIHLGFTEEDDCHIGDCKEVTSSCCDSEIVHIAPVHMDYTNVSIVKLNHASAYTGINFNFGFLVKNQTKPFFKEAFQLSYPPPQEIRDQTLITRC